MSSFLSRKQFAFLPLLLTVMLSSCSNSTPESTALNPAFASFVSGHTFGVVSANSTVEIRFTTTPSSAVQGAEVTDKKLVQLTPNTPGKLIWKDEQILQFIPEKPFKQNEKYTVTVQLERLFDTPEALETFVFEFSIIPQFITVGTHKNVPYTNDGSGACRIEGHFTSTDFLDPSILSTVFEGKLNGKKVKLNWTSKGTQLTFTLDSVVRDLNDQLLSLSLDGKKAGFEQKETFDIVIPSIDNFQLLHIRSTNEDNQKVTLTFSDPINPNSLLPGLVTLGSSDKLRTEVNGAVLTIYPKERISGAQRLFVQKNITNIYGYSLKANVEREVLFESLKPAVAFLSDGSILPSTNGLKVGFRAVNLKAVDVVIFKIFESNIKQFLQDNSLDGSNQLKRVARPVYEKRMDLSGGAQNTWQVYGLDLEKLITPDPGAIYRVELHFRQSYSTYPCSQAESFSGDAATYTPANFDNPGYDYLSYWNDPNYKWSERENPCHPTYYYQTSKTAQKNILATNIGLIVKANDRGSYLAIATDLRTAKPLSGVTVTLYNLQQQELLSQKTDSKGMVTLETNEQPFLAIASQGKEKTYLRIDAGSTLSLSSFDVSGSTVHDGLKGFLYGERGVWRPGDTVFLNFILDDSANPLPKGHPLVFTLQNPQGQIIDQQTLQTPGKIFPFTTRTLVDAPTGYYLAKVQIGGAEFTKSIRIESVKPNRLRIQLKESADGVLTREHPEFTISSEWLTGATAAGYKTVVEMAVRKGSGRFAEFPGFLFQDKVGSFYANQQHAIEEKLDGSGKLRLQPNVSESGNLPGMLDIAVFTRVFEPGGDFSVNRTTLKYAPYNALVGLKIPKSKKSPWLQTGEDHTIQVASVSPSGKKMNRKLTYEIYEVGWSWWYNRSRGEGFYLNDKYLNKVANGKLTTKDGLGAFPLRIEEPLWGHFLIRVCDDVSGHCTAETVYIDWPMSSQRGKKAGSGPAMLKFWADKDQYQTGEVATVNIPSSPDAQLLISIESGGQIIDKQWIQGKENFTTFSLPITEKMAPNVYVFIAQLQPHGQTANDLPIRTYGILPIAVENPKTIIKPKIKTAEKWKPNAPFSITVSEENGQPMTYTLAIVDEGLLGLTNFTTPDPHNYFFSKEALGIRTWDMYNHVISAYGGRMEQLMAVGGGDDLKTGKSKTNLRFVPVVMVTEPIQLEKGKSSTHEFTMPNYVGSVRVMVVAAEKSAYGHAEKEVPVKLPLMVQATLPRVLGPNETIKIPVQLFAMETDVNEVQVTAKVRGAAKLTVASAAVTFSETGEKMVNLELETGEETGLVTIEIDAKSGAFKAKDKTTLEIRYPTQAQTVSQWTKIDAGKSASLTQKAIGLKGSNSAVIEISGMPDINLYKRLDYLIGYPHGCLEQQISRVFPQIFLDRFITLTQEEKAKINDQYSKLIAHLLQLQHHSGGLVFWPGGTAPSDWGSTYALHFLEAAAQQGYQVPAGLKANLLRYQSEQARRFSQDKNRKYLTFSQVYRLYVLALAGKPELGAMNRIRTEVSGTSANLLAAAYHLAGQQSSAQQLFGSANMTNEAYRMPYTFGSQTRDQAILLTCAQLLKREQLAQQLAQQLTTKLASDTWLSTQETAWSLLALSEYFKGIDKDAPFEGLYQLNSGKQEKVAGKNTLITKKAGDQDNYEVTLQNTGTTPIYMRLSNTGVPEMGNEVEQADNVGLSVTYLNSNREVISVERLPQGTDFFARVVVHRTNPATNLSDLVLTQIFPSGWQIIENSSDILKAGVDFRDVRDDRVYTYFNLQNQPTQTFEVRLNATYRGSYYLPPVQVEGMYSNEIGALKRGKQVEVY